MMLCTVNFHQGARRILIATKQVPSQILRQGRRRPLRSMDCSHATAICGFDDCRHHSFSTLSRTPADSSTTSSQFQNGINARSVYDKSPDWPTWFESPEYIHAWSSDDLEPLDDAPVVDNQSRMVLDLLQKLFQVGLTKTVDRVTTERVHVILQQLEDLPQQSTQSMWQRAERGRALLEAMEQFEELRDEPHLPLSLPLPTHETYWRILRMYSSKFLHGTKAKNQNVPAICRAMVQRMQDSGHLELQPTAMHWNQVLSAYANSTSENRSVEAAKLLYELDSKGMSDASSFSHALRACSAMTARHQVATPKFVEMAIPVARRIWYGLKQSEIIDIQPFHFTHMLRVFRNIPDVTKRDESAHQVFTEAMEAQKVNIHVLSELLEVASPDLMVRLLGTSDYPTEAEKLIRQVPTTWVEDVGDGGKSPYEW